MKKSLVISVILILAIGAVVYFSTRQKNIEVQSIKIGVIEALSGTATYYGEQNRKGVEIALEEIKSKYPDIKWQVFHEDSFYTPKGGVDAYEKLHSIEKIDAVITHASPVAIAIQPLAKRDGILQMAVSSSATTYSSPKDLSFRVSPVTDIEAETISNFIKDKNFKRVAFLSMKNEVGDSIVSSVIKRLSASGIEIVAKESFLLDTSDFRSVLSKIKSSKSDAIYTVGTAGHLVSILKEAKDQKINTQFLGFRSSEDPTLLKAGSSAEGFIYTYGFDPGDNSEAVNNFTDRYKAKYNELPDGYAAEGYEGMKLVMISFGKCGKDYACIEKYLENTKNYDSIFGPMSFDENGDVSYKFFLKTVKDAKFVRYSE